MVLTMRIISLIVGNNKHNNKQHKQHSKHGKHNKHKNTWFSTPKKARNPGHANHVLKTKL